MHDHVNSVRGVARWVLRSVALALAAIGLYLILKRLAFAAFTGNLSGAFMFWEGIGDGHAGSRGTAMLLIAGILGLAGDRLVRWAIPVPPEGCPRCGHAHDPDAANPRGADAPAGTGAARAAGAADDSGRAAVQRCPECGFTSRSPRPSRDSSTSA